VYVHRRLRSCPSTFNCVSTSSKSSDQYASPWISAATTTAAAAEAIIGAVSVVCPQAELLQNEALPSGQYLRFHVPGRFQLPDELEFLVRSTGVSGRNWEGDDDGGLLVTLRSIAGTVQCAHAPGRLRTCARVCSAAADALFACLRSCVPIYDARVGRAVAGRAVAAEDAHRRHSGAACVAAGGLRAD
jgi:hypothetical protein